MRGRSSVELIEENGNGAPHSVDPQEADMGRMYAEYVSSAREEFFGDAKSIAPEEWSTAAVGLITLLVLGGIIISQVL